MQSVALIEKLKISSATYRFASLLPMLLEKKIILINKIVAMGEETMRFMLAKNGTTGKVSDVSETSENGTDRCCKIPREI